MPLAMTAASVSIVAGPTLPSLRPVSVVSKVVSCVLFCFLLLLFCLLLLPHPPPFSFFKIYIFNSQFICRKDQHIHLHNHIMHFIIRAEASIHP